MKLLLDQHLSFRLLGSLDPSSKILDILLTNKASISKSLDDPIESLLVLE